MSYLDELLQQLSEKAHFNAMIASVDPGGVPLGDVPEIPTQVFEEIETEIALARKHRNRFRQSVQKAVRICRELEGRRQRALRHYALIKQLKAIQKAADKFANELGGLSIAQAGHAGETTSANEHANNQWIRDNLEELLHNEVRSWVEEGRTLPQRNTSADTNMQIHASPHEVVFSNLHAYASPAEDVTKACRILLADLERTKPTRGRPKNQAFGRFAKGVSAALKAAGLPSKLTLDTSSDGYQRTGPLLTITLSLLDLLPEEAIPGSRDDYRCVAIEEALHRAVSNGQNSTQSRE